MIKHETGYRHGQRTHELTWTVNPIPRAIFAQCSARITPRKYCLDDKLECSGLKPYQCTYLQTALIRERAIKRAYVIAGKLDKILQDYKHMSMQAISAKYDIPPIMTMRMILINRGISRSDVSAFLGKRIQFADSYDKKQLASAYECDIDNWDNVQAIQLIAQQHEDAFAADIMKYVPAKTQDTLTQEQIEQHGRAVITPDVLFTEPTYINGVRIHWIDYKDYTVAPITFILPKIREQAAKYNKKWGYGAIVCNGDFIEGIDVPAMLLSGQRADKKITK